MASWRSPKLPLIPGHEIVGRVERCGAGVEGFARGDASASHGSAGPAANVPTVAPGARTCAAALHRLHARWRLRRVHRGRCALLLSPAGWLRRRPGRAAALRRIDRLPLAGAGRRRQRLGIYGFGAAAHIIDAGGAFARSRRSSPSRARATPRRKSSRAGLVPSGRGAPTKRRLSRSTRQSSSRRSGARAGWRCGRSRKGGRWSAAAST